MGHIWIVCTDSGAVYMSFTDCPSEYDIKQKARTMLKDDPANEVLQDWAEGFVEWGYLIEKIPLFDKVSK